MGRLVKGRPKEEEEHEEHPQWMWIVASLGPPKLLELRRRKLGVPDRVLDVPMTEPCLQRPRVMTGIRQCIAAGVAQHVRKDREGHTNTLA